jgi:AP-1 complex subunit sigma 1/2
VRFSKWYSSGLSLSQKNSYLQEVSQLVISRSASECSFLVWQDKKIVYRRFASLLFILVIESDENELLALEIIQFIVEVFDKYFSSVCELDIIFNFHKVFLIIDEILMAGCLLDC